MFKFGFSETPFASENVGHLAEETLESEEVKKGSIDLCNGSIIEMSIGPYTIKYLKRDTVQKALNKEFHDNNLAEAEKSNSDIVPGIYEGGLKIWECTTDLLHFMVNKENIFTGKRVLDLGCGAGLLGIMALKMGALSVHFQDYNKGVLEGWAMPNVFCHSPIAFEHSKFWSGDWSSFSRVNSHVYDVILSSETIYNPDNYSKLYSVLKDKLVDSGRILLAAKCYYFGVGGTISQFQEFCKKDDYFSTEILWSSQNGVKREIMAMSKKHT